LKILIAGATGLIGNELTNKLLTEGHSVSILSRSKTSKIPKTTVFVWNPEQGEIDLSAFNGVDAIINLAGAGVADKRWTSAYKQTILDSRINSTQLLINSLQITQNQVHTFINASAIGFYGTNTGSNWVDENTKCGEDFLADVVQKWEKEAFKAQNLNIRTVAIRIGIVLSGKGGALPKMALPVKYYFGAALGSGNQYVSWIDIDDLVSIFIYCLTNKTVNGAINAVAPAPVTNKEFNTALAKQINRMVFLPNLPSIILKIIIGEFAASLLGGNRVFCTKITQSGFKFQHKTPSFRISANNC
jgi:uncharacterized protein (TIGR01777 family)